MKRILTMLLLCLVLEGCYYMQAASGQWQVLRKREPLVDVVNDPETPQQLASRLRLLDEARDFSIAELGLPDNNSYRTYADIERDYVLWNVFAAPEFSLEARRWCFPVAGCVSYRGYFKRDRALREAERLREKGFDVAVGGVSAYSTLGKFSDPVLSTMLRKNDAALVAVLFHELAHQVIYVKGDTAFNESFATAVEEFGVQRWLVSKGRQAEFDQYIADREYQQRLMTLVKKTRTDLRVVYSGSQSESQKRLLKSARLARLGDDTAAEAARSGRPASGWLSGDLNNAHLISMSLYEGRLPEFRALLGRCNDDLQCFYGESRKLADVKVRKSR